MSDVDLTKSEEPRDEPSTDAVVAPELAADGSVGAEQPPAKPAKRPIHRRKSTAVSGLAVFLGGLSVVLRILVFVNHNSHHTTSDRYFTCIAEVESQLQFQQAVQGNDPFAQQTDPVTGLSTANDPANDPFFRASSECAKYR